MEKRVVITGLGSVSPNGLGNKEFLQALKDGRSGVKYSEELAEVNFGSKIAGVPDISGSPYLTHLEERGLLSTSLTIAYSCIAGMEAYVDAGFTIPKHDSENVDYDTGVIIGSCMGSSDLIMSRIAPALKAKTPKRLGARTMEQVIMSGLSSHVSSILALGNQCFTMSSACAAGVESILLGYDRILMGKATRMLVGGADGKVPSGIAGLDATRVPSRSFHDNPEAGSRPMSASADGLVYGSGAGMLMIEDLESALERNAKIYAEIGGGAVQSGGHRKGGTMTASNPEGVQRCIKEALKNANVEASDIDCISGHLTGTRGDPEEIKNWVAALNRGGKNFPYINSLKSMIGHGFGASGALETIAGVLQVSEGFVHPSINCEDLHPAIKDLIDEKSIPKETIHNFEVKYLAKASIGFGDVNACIIIKKFTK